MIGNLYLWGNIEPYVVSYFHWIKNDPEATSKNALIIIPLSFTIQSFFNVLGSFMQQRVNPKLIIALGSLISLLAILIASQAQNWNTFVVFYAGVFPMGIGFLYWTPLICAWEWFPDKKGLISGLIIGAFGFGALIFGFVTTWIVNPENQGVVMQTNGEKYIPETQATRVPKMFRVCLVIWTILLVAGCMLISRNPEFVNKN